MAASAAFATEDQELDSREIRDTVAELAHMTAGNLKSILPDNSEIYQPDATDGCTGGGESVAVAGFSFDGEPLVVTLRGRDLEA